MNSKDEKDKKSRYYGTVHWNSGDQLEWQGSLAHPKVAMSTLHHENLSAKNSTHYAEVHEGGKPNDLRIRVSSKRRGSRSQSNASKIEGAAFV